MRAHSVFRLDASGVLSADPSIERRLQVPIPEQRGQIIPLASNNLRGKNIDNPVVIIYSDNSIVILA